MGMLRKYARHSLSQPVRADSSLREGAKGASHQGTTSRPYRGVVPFIEPLYYTHGLACNTVTGRVREVPYWYTPRRVIKKTGGGSRLSLQVED